VTARSSGWRLDRRAFLLGTGGAGVAVALAACGGSPVAADTAARYTGDYRSVALAAALENQAVAVYQGLLVAARTGTLDAQAPAFAGLARTCISQHAQHAEAWNAILRAARKPAVGGVPLTGHASVMHTLDAASTLDQAAVLCLELENQAAQTYAVAAGSLANPVFVATAASIAPVEAMHAAILAFMAGGYPSPATFGGTTQAARTSELTI
jgi:Ferritin-like domain